jgi:hypothetical protein
LGVWIEGKVKIINVVYIKAISKFGGGGVGGCDGGDEKLVSNTGYHSRK